MKKYILLVFTLLALSAWSPWITKNYAERSVYQGFISEQQGIVDGCGFNCAGCGVKSSKKILFGYSVQIEYACGFSITDLPGLHRRLYAFVSPIGTIHNYSYAIPSGEIR